jgi:two-component system, response regulator RegA
VRTTHDVPFNLAAANEDAPEYAVIGINMLGPSGLEMIKQLKQLDESTRMVVPTGHASGGTAVKAIKLGAVHYLAKPADADEILAAFHRIAGDAALPVTPQPLAIARLEWKHIQKVFPNVRATSRKPRAASACAGARCNTNSPSVRGGAD